MEPIKLKPKPRNQGVNLVDVRMDGGGLGNHVVQLLLISYIQRNRALFSSQQ